MALTQDTLERVAKILTDKYGIRVVISGNRCCTDGRTIYLPTMPPVTSPKVLALIRSFLDHEAGHIVGDSDMPMLQDMGQEHGSTGQAILNALEDVRIEALMAGLWAGCGENLRTGAMAVAERLDKLAAAGDEGVLNPLKMVTADIYQRGRGLAPAHWITDEIHAVVDKYEERILSIPRWAKVTGDLRKLANEITADFKAIYATPNDQPRNDGEAEDNDAAGEGVPQAGGKGTGHGPQQESSNEAESSDDDHAGGDTEHDTEGEVEPEDQPEVEAESDPDDAGQGEADDGEDQTDTDAADDESEDGDDGDAGEAAVDEQQGGDEGGSDGDTEGAEGGDADGSEGDDGDGGDTEGGEGDAGSDAGSSDGDGGGTADSDPNSDGESSSELMEDSGGGGNAGGVGGGNTDFAPPTDASSDVASLIQKEIGDAEKADPIKMYRPFDPRMDKVVPIKQNDMHIEMMYKRNADNKRFYATHHPDEAKHAWTSDAEYMADVQRAGGPMRQRLLQLLKSEDKVAWRGGLTRGTPDPRNLAKLATRVSDRVMRKQRVDDAPDTACMLLVDMSGSMRSGTRMQCAMLAASAFSNVLDSSGHACMVAGFKDDGEHARLTAEDMVALSESMIRTQGVNLWVAKGWNETYRRSLRKQVQMNGMAGGGTPLGEGMVVASRELLKRPENRKVMIVFTDGDPGIYCRWGNPALTDMGAAQFAKAYVAGVAQRIEAAGCEVVFIGIQSDAVTTLGRHVVVNDTESLAKTVMVELTKALKHTSR